MVKTLAIKVRGMSPLLMHKYNGAQPTAKKVQTKTQTWIDETNKKDWTRSAYWSDDLGFFIPGEAIDAAIVEGARRNRRGKDFQAFCFCQEDRVPLTVYAGPEDKDGRHLRGKLTDYYVPAHVDLRGVVIQRNRIDRCRPIFRHWGLEFTVQYDDEFVGADDIQSALKYTAIGDFRPRFGRFSVQDMKAAA